MGGAYISAICSFIYVGRSGYLCAAYQIYLRQCGNRLSRQKEIVVQTRGALNDEEDLSIYEEELSYLHFHNKLAVR